MPPIDMYHVIAIVVGVVLKLLWERFVGPAPTPTPGPQPAPLSLPGLLDNPNALQLLRELLHATPPKPSGENPQAR